MKKFYTAFGLHLESDIAIPQFIEGRGVTADVVIRYGSVRSVMPVDTEHDNPRQIGDEIFFYWNGIGAFLVRGGCEIVVDRLPEAGDEIVRLPLVGVAMAALLQQRRLLVLHASAVSIAGNATAFLGWKGAGKSTTSAILYGRGHAAIADDVVALRVGNLEPPLVQPTFPSFKLMPETAFEVLGDDIESLARVVPISEKRYRSFGDNFVGTEVELKAIFVLKDGPRLEMRRLPPQESLSSLVANCYLARYGKLVMNGKTASENFYQCSQIVNQVPVFEVNRPKHMDSRGELADLLEKASSANFEGPCVSQAALKC